MWLTLARWAGIRVWGFKGHNTAATWLRQATVVAAASICVLPCGCVVHLCRVRLPLPAVCTETVHFGLTSSQAAIQHVPCPAYLLSLHVGALTSTLTLPLDPHPALQQLHPLYTLQVNPLMDPHSASQPVSSSVTGWGAQANVNPETHLRPGRHGEWTTVSGLGPKAGPTWGVDVTPPGMKVGNVSSCPTVPSSTAWQVRASGGAPRPLASHHHAPLHSKTLLASAWMLGAGACDGGWVSQH